MDLFLVPFIDYCKDVVERREFTPVKIPKESQKEKQELCILVTCRLPEEEEEEETAGESLSGKPAPFGLGSSQ